MREIVNSLGEKIAEVDDSTRFDDATEFHVEPDGETPQSEGARSEAGDSQAPPADGPEALTGEQIDALIAKADQLEAQVAELQGQVLTYDLLMDVQNNRMLIQRHAGSLVVQEIWEPGFAKQFAHSLIEQVDALANERRKWQAQVRKAAAEAEAQGRPGVRQPAGKLWTPADPRMEAAGPAAMAAARARR